MATGVVPTTRSLMMARAPGGEVRIIARGAHPKSSNAPARTVTGPIRSERRFGIRTSLGREATRVKAQTLTHLRSPPHGASAMVASMAQSRGADPTTMLAELRDRVHLLDERVTA